MAELRRLLIDRSRLSISNGSSKNIPLNQEESHYVKRVLRLRELDPIEIVDGNGRLWEAFLNTNSSIHLTSTLDSPLILEPIRTPFIGIAIALPKKGFEDFIRMSCEAGIDKIQPLFSDRSVVKSISDDRQIRWNSIIRESVEQCERLWKPEISQILNFKEWLPLANNSRKIAISLARSTNKIAIYNFINELKVDFDELWIAIGPEGGWSLHEQKLAEDHSLNSISLGDFIMRTSTAGVVAAYCLASWRNQNLNFSQ